MIPSRENHPRIWAVAIWLAVSAVPILIGWAAGRFHLPQLIFWTLLIVWGVPWIIVSTGLWMVFTPTRAKANSNNDPRNE